MQTNEAHSVAGVASTSGSFLGLFADWGDDKDAAASSGGVIEDTGVLTTVTEAMDGKRVAFTKLLVSRWNMNRNYHRKTPYLLSRADVGGNWRLLAAIGRYRVKPKTWLLCARSTAGFCCGHLWGTGIYPDKVVFIVGRIASPWNLVVDCSSWFNYLRIQFIL